MTQPECACGKPISRETKSGRCRRCARLNHVANWTPEQRASAQAHGHRMIVHVHTPGALAKSLGSAARAVATAKRRQTMMGWCPDELLPLYRDLRDRKGMGRKARAVVEDLIPGTAAHARRAVANAADAMRIKHERDVASRY